MVYSGHSGKKNMFTLCIFLHSFPGVHHISPLQGNKDISFSSVLCGDYFYPKVEKKKEKITIMFHYLWSHSLKKKKTHWIEAILL